MKFRGPQALCNRLHNGLHPCAETRKIGTRPAKSPRAPAAATPFFPSRSHAKSVSTLSVGQGGPPPLPTSRSEEHTTQLQSPRSPLFPSTTLFRSRDPRPPQRHSFHPVLTPKVSPPSRWGRRCRLPFQLPQLLTSISRRDIEGAARVHALSFFLGPQTHHPIQPGVVLRAGPDSQARPDHRQHHARSGAGGLRARGRALVAR